ncbi:peptidase [Histophilus somni]|uniref:peptidase n=1 Tax=Histophilus somni TaxID=731 RepID=UPI00094AF329|nr:peptidase [Histophilus somni]THA21157.1 peptidase [Histophilus somni]
MNLIEIFKAGKRRDANGVEVNITTADLQQAVESYNVEYHEAPAVIGHPKHNHPAYAWVKRLELDGDTLKAEFGQIDPEFAEMVETGRFKKVSASFYLANSPNNPKQGSLYLRHVGFLGAMPPAVKGLKNPEFNDSDEGIVEFEEPLHLSLSTPQGENQMDKDKQIEELQAKLAAAESAKAEAEQAKATAESEANQLKADKAAAEEAKAQAELEATKAENVAFCEKLIADGKLAPVAKETALALLNGAAAINAGQTVDFNEGENLLTLTKAFMEKQPKVVEFTEIATKEKAADQTIDEVSYAEGTDPTSIEADQKIRAYAKEKGVSYTQAFNAIYK